MIYFDEIPFNFSQNVCRQKLIFRQTQRVSFIFQTFEDSKQELHSGRQKKLKNNKKITLLARHIFHAK